MKKREFIFILFICVSIVLSGQTIKQDKKWNIEWGNLLCPGPVMEPCFCYGGITTIKTGNIKIFNDKEYYQIAHTYVREEEKKVFFYVEDCDKEYLLYDFGLNLYSEVVLVDPYHPTSFFDFENPCELTEEDIFYLTYKVTELDSIEKRKSFKLESLNDPYYYEIWVEEIGSMSGIIYNTSPFMVGGVKQLKDCYESDELFFVNENPRWCLDYSSIYNVSQVLIEGFIDNKNIFHIFNAENVPFIIYDLQGRKIKSFSPDCDNYKINISFAKKGLYIISNKEKNINFKVVVK